MTASEVVSTNGQGHGALVGFLAQHNANVVFCGGIGPGAQNAQRREKLPARLVGLTRGALEKEIGGLYENAAVTGFSAAEVDVSTRMDVPCPLHWVLRAGDDGLLAVLQNTTGETLTVVRRTDIPVALAAGEEQDELRDGRMFDDVQALEGYLESLSS